MGSPVAERLNRAVRALGVPIDGVSVRDPADRATWRIDYQSSATAQHRIDGEALRLSFDPTAQSAIDAETTDVATAEAALKDRIADIAWVLSQTDAGWAGATIPQKVAKVNTALNAWKTIRAFVEKNL